MSAKRDCVERAGSGPGRRLYDFLMAGSAAYARCDYENSMAVVRNGRKLVPLGSFNKLSKSSSYFIRKVAKANQRLVGSAVAGWPSSSNRRNRPSASAPTSANCSAAAWPRRTRRRRPTSSQQ